MSRVTPATSPHRNWSCGWSDRLAARPTSKSPTRPVPVALDRCRDPRRPGTGDRHRRDLEPARRSRRRGSLFVPQGIGGREPSTSPPPLTDHPTAIALCWLLVDTGANRRLVGRYPEIMQNRFPGSSVAWTRCIVDGTAPPDEPGCAWIDPRSERVLPLRLRRHREAPPTQTIGASQDPARYTEIVRPGPPRIDRSGRRTGRAARRPPRPDHRTARRSRSRTRRRR